MRTSSFTRLAFLFFCVSVFASHAFAFELTPETLRKLEKDQMVVSAEPDEEGVAITAIFLIQEPIEKAWRDMIDIDLCMRIYDEYKTITETSESENVTLMHYVLRAPFKTVSYTLRRTYAENNREFSWVLVSSDDLSRFDGRYTLEPLSENSTIVRYESRMILESSLANLLQSTFVEGFARKSIKRLIQGIESEKQIARK